MPDQQIERRQLGVYGVIGDLTFDSVVHVEQEGLEIIVSSQQTLTFDLSQVGRCSSAALALLLSWVRAAIAQGVDICFQKPPQQLLTMVHNANLQDIISFRI